MDRQGSYYQPSSHNHTHFFLHAHLNVDPIQVYLAASTYQTESSYLIETPLAKALL